jgi:voltage-gated potassium channel
MITVRLGRGEIALAELRSMATRDRPPATEPGSLVERRARRIANARSVTFGLAATFLGLAVVGAILMRIADPHNFPSLGLAVWWGLQTVTTVGYGDVVPTTTAGKIVGGVEMAFGVSLISLLTAAVTSTVIQRDEARAQEEDRAHGEQSNQRLLDALAQTKAEMETRLDRIESKLDST